MRVLYGPPRDLAPSTVKMWENIFRKWNETESANNLEPRFQPCSEHALMSLDGCAATYIFITSQKMTWVITFLIVSEREIQGLFPTCKPFEVPPTV